MAIKELITEVSEDIADIRTKNFFYRSTTEVPSIEDSALTYESGDEKKGKEVKTCILFADIRNSVELNRIHQIKTMGRLYSAFAKSCLKVARYHGGNVRNIIGDRVMIVFPAENCFTNAVDCAISINHIAKMVIDKEFKDIEFKVGIGIDYGDLKVIKVGIPRRGTETGENRGLVWVGYPANLASRLCDHAAKTLEKTVFKVTYNPHNQNYLATNFGLGSILGAPIASLSGIKSTFPIRPISNELPYLNSINTTEFTPSEFASRLMSFKDGEIWFSGGKLIKFEKEDRKVEFAPILMSEAVYKGFKIANSERKDVKNGWWKEQPTEIKNVSNKVFGLDTHWDLD